ncbi:hypothetical protein Q4589_02665 [Cobetia marina]|nr:transposase [Cobetia marina]MDO6786488.1 hypothetical protein [Cobetia marina]
MISNEQKAKVVDLVVKRGFSTLDAANVSEISRKSVQKIVRDYKKEMGTNIPEKNNITCDTCKELQSNIASLKKQIAAHKITFNYLLNVISKELQS